jgi:hypothetical protein
VNSLDGSALPGLALRETAHSFVARAERFKPAAPRRDCWLAITAASRLFSPIHARPLDVASSEAREAALVLAPSHDEAFDARFADASVAVFVFAANQADPTEVALKVEVARILVFVPSHVSPVDA